MKPTQFYPAFVFILASILVSTPAFTANSDFDGSLEIQSQSTFSRLKISIDPSFKPVLADTKEGFEIRVPGATLLDIGIPFGSEEKFSKFLTHMKDPRIGSIQMHEKDSGLTIQVKFSYPRGPDAFAFPAMEHFDFRESDRGKLVIDFWYKKGPTVAEMALKKKAEMAAKLKAEQDVILKREAERKASREKRIADSKNALLFCEQPFDRSNTVFMRFHPAHPILNFTAYFPEKIPDHRFEYHEPKGETEEAQMVRLALKLSRENNHALSVKTVDFLEKEYPKSRHLNEMRFLKANSFIRLGLDDKGREIMQDLARTARGTEVGLQCSAFQAVQSFKKQEWLTALNAFLNIRRENPQHPLNWLFRYGAAESLYQIRQSDQARAEYEWVSKNAPKDSIKAEAAFKIGDVYYERSQYAMAIQSYLTSIKKHEASLAQYPQVLMNLGESYFQLEEFGKSQDTFKRYLEIGRNQPNAWRASLRIAEITAMNQKQNATTEAAFTETVNHYPMTPGALIARLRLLPCGKHGGFDLAGAERFISSPEVEKFEGGDDLYSTSFKELTGLTEVRTLISFSVDEKTDEKAIVRGMARLRENPTIEVRRLIEQAMTGAVKRLLEKELNDGNAYGAIASYEKYSDYLPLPSHDPMADDLRMRLAKFASEKKLTTFALKVIEPYRKMNESEHREMLAAIEKNLSLEGTDEQDERNFIEVKTMWNSDKFDIADAKMTELFLTRLTSVREPSKFSFERDLLKALYHEEKKELNKASEIAEKLVSKMQRLTPGQKAQVWYWAAEIAQKVGHDGEAARCFREARVLVSNKQHDSGSDMGVRHMKSVPSISYLYTAEGEMLERQQKWKEAVALYTEAIENKIGGNHILFAHARALLKEGGRESRTIASRSLEKIKQSQEDDVWKNLAQKALDEMNAKEGKVNEPKN